MAATTAPPSGQPDRSPAPPLDRVLRQTGVAAPGAERPLVVALHGLGDRPESFAVLFEDLAAPASFIVPRAPLPWHDGHAWFPIDLWHLDPDALGPRIAEAADLVARSIEAWRGGAADAATRTRPKPIVVGYSQGGMIALYLALHRPELVEQAVVVAGWLPQSLWPRAGPTGAGPRIVALHGQADGVVPFAPTAELMAELAGLGYPVELRSFAGAGHRFDAELRSALREAVESAVKQARR